VPEQVRDTGVVEQRDGPPALLHVEHLPRAPALVRGHDGAAVDGAGAIAAGVIAAGVIAAGSRSARDRPVRARTA
jgi:hypothetical protein